MRPLSVASIAPSRSRSAATTPRQTAPGTQHKSGQRHITVDHRPTNLAQGEPGHIQLQLDSASEVDSLGRQLGKTLPTPVTVGLSGELGAHPLRQEQRVARDGTPYVNKLKSAQDPLQPYPYPQKRSGFLGVLTPRQAKVLAGFVSEPPVHYSVAGRLAGTLPRDRWTTQDIATYLGNGIVPDWGHNCVDFMREVVMALAETDCTDARALFAFRRAIDQAHRPEELARLIEQHFQPNAFSYLSFVPPALPPLVPTQLRNTPHFEAFREASGMSAAAFDKLAAHLEQRGLIFTSIFSNPDDKAWGLAFFRGLAERLPSCGANEAVGAVFYHRDMYEGNITHVSMLAITPEGDVCISNHESVPLLVDRKPVNNLMPGTLGLPANGYDTEDLFAHMEAKGVGKRHDTLPAMRSYRRTGPPLVMFDKLRDFAALEHRVEAMYSKSFQPDAAQWAYAADPDQRGSEIAAGVQGGLIGVGQLVDRLQPSTAGVPDKDRVRQVLGQRFHAEPAVPPPGEAVHGSYVNNCSWYTLQALRAGRSVALGDRRPDSTQSLSDVFRTMRDIGLQPDTDPALGDRMDRLGARPQGDELARHTASFLMGGSGDTGLASGATGFAPPHVPGREAAGQPQRQRVDDAVRREQEAREKADAAIDRFVRGPGDAPRR
ncbi:hypothetical protein ACLIJR_08675 [Hydrogenophaga sp. XSHU_21]